jgi:hypothetical protein
VDGAVGRRQVKREEGCILRGKWTRKETVSTLPVWADPPHPVIAADPLSDTGYVGSVCLWRPSAA